MFVWGGFGTDEYECADHTGARLKHGEYRDDGGLYDPGADAWRPLPTVGAPSPRVWPQVLWTGTEVIVWGGLGDFERGAGELDVIGARFTPTTGTWSPVFAPRDGSVVVYGHVVWTGTELLVWNGDDNREGISRGARYDPIGDAWRPISTVGAPSSRSGATVIWTGSEMIVWGGVVGSNSSSDRYLNDGARYDPTRDAWRPVTTTRAPSGRFVHRAVWTGRDMVIWGGARRNPSMPDDAFLVARYFADALTDGGWYDPRRDAWRPLPSDPLAYTPPEATYLWADGAVVVWGGSDPDPSGGAQSRAHGACLNVATGTWSGIPQGGPVHGTYWPDGRGSHTAVWTGDAMIGSVPRSV